MIFEKGIVMKKVKFTVVLKDCDSCRAILDSWIIQQKKFLKNRICRYEACDAVVHGKTIPVLLVRFEAAWILPYLYFKIRGGRFTKIFKGWGYVV